MSALQAWWSQRAARERSLLLGAGAVVVLALLWSVGLAPALRTLRAHDARAAQLEQQLAQMQQLQAQAQQLKALAPVAPGVTPQALEDASKRHLGRSSHWNIRSGSAQFQLQEVPAQALAQWLAAVRGDARARVLQARLQRSDKGWSGTIQVGWNE